MDYKTLQFRVTRSHPDYVVAERHCFEVRRLRNGMNSLLRTQYFHYRDGDNADLSIAEEYGVADDIRANAISSSRTDRLRKLVVPAQRIDLPAKVAQTADRSLKSSWQSFYSLRKKGMSARIPGYSKAYHVAEYNTQAISGKKLKEKRVVPTQWSVGFSLPEGFSGEVRSARVIPEGNSFMLHVLYEDNEPADYTPTPGLVAGVDPGLNNLFTIAFNDLREGIIVDGRPLKKLNSHYNTVIAKLTSKLDIEKRNISKKVNKGLTRKDEGYVHVYRSSSIRLEELWAKRHRKMKHYYTTATNRVVDQLCEAGVETVVIGWNQGNKQRINIGRRNNRNFVQVPIAKILDNLAWKCEAAGIKVVRTEESYTSKSSFIDGDPLPAHGDGQPRPKFSGRRVRRGLYRTGERHLVNADLNGALNIIRKYDPHFSYEAAASRKAGVDAGTRFVVPSVRRVAFSY